MSESPHPQARAAVEARRVEGVPPAHTLSTADYRRRFRAVMTAQSTESVRTTTDFAIPGPSADVPVRTYHPGGDGPLPVVVFFHGGGWELGDLECFDPLCTRLANRADALVVSVGYRLAPEYPFPAAPLDCYAATEWVATHAAEVGGDPDRIAVAGTSAGGNLATVVCMLARDRDGPDLAQQTLVYPAVNPVGLHVFDSYRTYATGYSLTTASMRRFYDAYLSDPIDGRNAYAFPLEAADHAGLPPATVLSAEFDPLRDEAFAYVRRLEADGVAVSHHHYDDMIHDFLSMPDEIDAATDGIETIAVTCARCSMPRSRRSATTQPSGEPCGDVATAGGLP